MDMHKLYIGLKKVQNLVRRGFSLIAVLEFHLLMKLAWLIKTSNKF
jgi:hypothetical protein